MDQKDLRGKTPLELAVFLNHFKCAKILAEFGADCGVITKSGWNCKLILIKPSTFQLKILSF